MRSAIDYEKVLNPAQWEAVTTLTGPVLVIAGAGSGKTRTLVYRVARLIESGVRPESILLLTFTRRAAQEMLERAANLSDERCRRVSGGTFHSLAHRVLRTRAEALGFAKTFSILDRSDMEEVLRSLTPELQMPKGGGRFPKRSTLATLLSKAANLEQPVDEVLKDEYGQFLEFVPHLNQLARLYASYKKANQLMDYDDLIIHLRDLLAHHPEVRVALANDYKYVMVDEYQDTNSIQAEIVLWLSHEHRNVMVVGDDCQAIYSFRGANYRNMFDFPLRFPSARLIKLEENYRSTQPVLTFANALMNRAQEKYTKCLFTRREGGERPKIMDVRTEPEQAMFVCQTILNQVSGGRSVKDFAVLFRASYHSFELEAELTRQGVPYVKYGGFKFLESAHIKDFLCHLRVVANREDALSWVRILRLLDHVGEAKSQAIIRWMRENRIPPERLEEWPAKKNDKGLGALSQLFKRLTSTDLSPRQAVEQVMEYYVPILKERFDDYPRRQKELEQIAVMASRYKKVGSFLDDLVLDPPNTNAEIDGEEKRDTLTLSTVHSAKGLEWSVVFIIWASEGRFPPSRASTNFVLLEEERRLMYVAATRAKDELIICYPSQESSPFGSGFEARRYFSGNGLSSFIEGLSQEVVSYESPKRYSGTGSTATWGSERSEARTGIRGSGGFSSGDRVRHPAFGAGVVSRLIPGNKVEVFFRDVGRKLLHMDYTTLEKV